MSAAGAAMGVAAGAWLGYGMTAVYADFFHFPILEYRLPPLVVVQGVAGALLVVGLFSIDSIDVLLDAQFSRAQRYDALVTFALPRSASAAHAVRRLPGVRLAEGFRAVPARLRTAPTSGMCGSWASTRPARCSRSSTGSTTSSACHPRGWSCRECSGILWVSGRATSSTSRSWRAHGSSWTRTRPRCCTQSLRCTPAVAGRRLADLRGRSR